MIFTHVNELGEKIALDTLQDTCLVADAWAFLQPPYGPEGGETHPIIMVANLVIGGFKIYWGTNIQTYNYILAHGVCVRSEALARMYSPMLKDVPFVKE